MKNHPTELLERCRSLNIRLEAEGDRLEIDAPAGTLSHGLLDEIRSNKAALLAELTHEPAPVEPEASGHPLDLWFSQQDWRRWRYTRGRYIGPETFLTQGAWT